MNRSTQDEADTYEHQLAAALAAGATVRSYDQSSVYRTGELVRHDRDGLGVVIGLSKGYVEIWFAGGKRNWPMASGNK